MKNIHVLPTKLASEYYLTKDGILEESYSLRRGGAVHFYITSDEEIKEGDWYYNHKTNSIQRRTEGTNNESYIGFKKIILTDNKELQKDGVQVIDYEFLQWFIKNPSCEEVGFEKEILKLVHNPNYINHTPEGDGIYLTPKSENLQYGETLIEDNVINYKIIIPKEEIYFEFTGELDELPNLSDVIREKFSKKEKTIYNKLDVIKDLLFLKSKFQHVHKYYPLSDKELTKDNFDNIIEDLIKYIQIYEK